MTFKNFTLKELVFLKKNGLDKYMSNAQYLMFGTELETIMNHPEYYKGRSMPIYLVDLIDKGCIIYTTKESFDKGNYVGYLVKAAPDDILYRLNRSVDSVLRPEQIQFQGGLPTSVIMDAEYNYKISTRYKSKVYKHEG